MIIPIAPVILAIALIMSLFLLIFASGNTKRIQSNIAKSPRRTIATLNETGITPLIASTPHIMQDNIIKLNA
jgi:uncharacterized protein YoxC